MTSTLTSAAALATPRPCGRTLCRRLGDARSLELAFRPFAGASGRHFTCSRRDRRGCLVRILGTEGLLHATDFSDNAAPALEAAVTLVLFHFATGSKPSAQRLRLRWEPFRVLL